MFAIFHTIMMILIITFMAAVTFGLLCSLCYR
jgi:hypothetical protein